MRQSFESSTLLQLRVMPSEAALALLTIDLKMDPSFVPLKDSTSRRWHARTAHGEFEILTTGTKWYDTRAKRGGGGAIDLAVYLCDLSFVDAVKLLMRRQCVHG
jgi:hypothetical protein